jgi:hypothetical protein
METEGKELKVAVKPYFMERNSKNTKEEGSEEEVNFKIAFGFRKQRLKQF